MTDLTVAYEDDTALTGVHVHVGPGDAVAVLGAAGAGKSTLAQVLAGLIPDLVPGTVSGEIDIPDVLGYVPQDAAAALIEPVVGDDVGYGLPTGGRTDRVAGALAAVGLDGFQDRRTGELSGGQVQRVAIAGALARGADFIILDDPTSELDAQGRDSVLAALSPLTALVTTHDPHVAMRCSRAVVLDRGRVAFDGVPAELYADPGRCQDLGLRTPCTGDLRLRIGAPMPDIPGDVVAEVTDLDFRYPNGVQALAGADLTVARGEVVALRGANGAGKSTLARCVAGLLSTTGGVRVEGRVAMVFQNPDTQLFADTVAKEVGYAARCQGRGEEEVTELVDAALAATGLTSSADRHPMRLSRSGRQLVAVSSALAADPDLLILDEPTAGLDGASFDAVALAVARAAASGVAVLLITHDDELAGLATRTVTLAAPPVAATQSGEQTAPATWRSRLWDPRPVGWTLLAALVVAVAAPSWPILAALLVLGAVAVTVSVPSGPAKLLRTVAPLAPLAVLMGVFGYLVPPTFAHDPLTYAVMLVLRLLAMVCWTVWAVAKFDGELAISRARASRLPVTLVLVVTIAMRFVPTLQARLGQIRAAQESRGAHFGGGPIYRARAMIAVLIPLFVGAIRTSHHLAAALTVRGVVEVGRRR